MERLLLLMATTTYKAAAFLDAARTLGVDVVVGSDRPHALAALRPTAVVALPFTDAAAAVQRLQRATAGAAVDAIVAADDEGVVLAAQLSQALGLPHNSVAAVTAARDKLLTRRALQAAGLPVPPFRCFDVAADPRHLAPEVDYPCVLKPRMLSGSRGVIRADGPQEFVVAFERVCAILSSPDLRDRGDDTTHILVEDYIPGTEVAVEGLLVAGELRMLALFDKPDPLDGPFFQETIYVTPSRLPPARQTEVEDCVRRAVTAIGLHRGPVHAEVRFNRHGIYLLEAAPRSIGGLCARALRFGAGDVSLEELLLRAALGRDTASLAREACAAGVMMIPIPRAGILRAVDGVDAARAVEDVDDVRITVSPGQPVQPPPEGARYLGFIFARAATPARVESALRTSHAQLVLDIGPAAGDTGADGARLQPRPGGRKAR